MFEKYSHLEQLFMNKYDKNFESNLTLNDNKARLAGGS